MDEEVCDSGTLWNIPAKVPLDNVVLSVYYWDWFQLLICSMVDCCSYDAGWCFDQIKYLPVASIPIQVVALRLW